MLTLLCACLVPLMYIFEISDMLFFIKNLKNPMNNFKINTYISFSAGNTRSYGVKLRWLQCIFTNKKCHFYFNRIGHLWNSLPIIDLNLPINIIKSKIKSQCFIMNFDSDNMHRLHYLALVVPVHLIIPQAVIITCDI